MWIRYHYHEDGPLIYHHVKTIYDNIAACGADVSGGRYLCDEISSALKCYKCQQILSSTAKEKPTHDKRRTHGSSAQSARKE